MLYFLGNCQSEFLCRSLAGRGHACTHRIQASPLTYPSHPGSVPDSLLELDRAVGLSGYLEGRELESQFNPIGPQPPELILLNLYHENVPLFVHEAEQYTFFMTTDVLNDHAEAMAWAQAHCRMFKPGPASYLDRFGTMLRRVRRDFPSVPVIVLTRLSPFPAFGPDPYSYLQGWDAIHARGAEVMRGWASELEDVHVLDMDRVFGGIWNASDKRIETHCPFLKITLTEENGRVTGLHARRDIEHIGPMPEKLADKVEGFLETGTITYEETEAVLSEWRRPPSLRRLEDDAIRAKLASGANYLGAEAVASFFLDLGRDYTPFLAEARETMPVCHMTLHMIKAYGRIHPTPPLAEWCDAHLEKARAFTDNGPLYQRSYVERVLAIREAAA
jgi:hypothetical protein